jgi:hypothetical protein
MAKQDSTVKTLEQCGEAGQQAIEKYESTKGERKTMVQATEPQRTSLTKYETKMQLTQADVTDIVKTLWPTAPVVEVKKAITLCMQYRLNPLAKHIYLIPFDKWQDGKLITTTWTMVWGIEATRLVARRAARKHKTSYGYVDFSPRIMTEAEQEKINGKVDNTKIWAITILKDERGNECFGVGFWPKTKMVKFKEVENQPKGTDKGNSMENMAKLRSERNAINRLFPGEMPDEETVELEDTRYMDTPIITEVRGELPEAEVIDEEPETPEEQPQAPAEAVVKSDANVEGKPEDTLETNISKLLAWGVKKGLSSKDIEKLLDVDDLHKITDFKEAATKIANALKEVA